MQNHIKNSQAPKPCSRLKCVYINLTSQSHLNSKGTYLEKLREISLGIPLNVALVQARINAERNVLGDVLPEGLNVLAVQSRNASESGLHDIGSQGEEVLRNLRHTGVGIIEARHEDGALAVRVELLMDAASGEDSHLVQREGVLNGSRAILHDKVGHQAALDDNVQLRRTRMHMRSVHATRPQEADGHGGAVADERGKRLCVRRHGEAARAASLRGRGRDAVVEVEGKVAGLAEELEAVDLGRRGEQLGDELVAAGAGVDGDDGGEEGLDVVHGGDVVCAGRREGGSGEEEDG